MKSYLNCEHLIDWGPKLLHIANRVNDVKEIDYNNIITSHITREMFLSTFSSTSRMSTTYCVLMSRHSCTLLMDLRSYDYLLCMISCCCCRHH